MQFEWDPAKAQSNREKHGVDFTEAMTVFADPLEATIPDEDHSETEPRYRSVGKSMRDRVLVVSYSEIGGVLRIISARRATPSEIRQYEKQQ